MGFKMLPLSDLAIDQAVMLLKQGKLVAFPTETVYGLGADAENEGAVASIYSTKGRPSNNPLILHVSSFEMAEKYGAFNNLARDLANKHWPGPLTIVVNKKDKVSFYNCLSKEVDTVAIRILKSHGAQNLIKKLGRAIVAPSANRSGRISPTQASHVVDEFYDSPGNLAMILDGGATESGIESTVICCTDDQPKILRFGGLLFDELQYNVKEYKETTLSSGVLLSPGMLESHYAPNLPLRLNAEKTVGMEALLAFGVAVDKVATSVFNLSKTQNLEEAAQNLYTGLRELDKSGCSGIAVMPIPEKGIGIAINDRLRRAAAPRPKS